MLVVRDRGRASRQGDMGTRRSEGGELPSIVLGTKERTRERENYRERGLYTRNESSLKIRARLRTRARTGQLPQQRELFLSGLLAGSEKQLAEMHVTPGSRAEQGRNRHIGAGSLAGARVELRELQHFHYRIARLTAGEIRYCEAAVIIGPVRQRFTAQQVDGDPFLKGGSFAPGF